MKNQKIARSLDWNLLKTFYDVAAEGGVTSAANAAGRKQSTISMALQRLEATLGKKLCQRGRVGFELTAEGKLVNDAASDIYDIVDHLQHDLNTLSKRKNATLRICAINNFISSRLDKILISCNSRIPDLELKYSVTPWMTIPDAVLQDETDAGICPIVDQKPELRYDFLERENHCIFCGPGHHLFGKKSVQVQDLAAETFILAGEDEPESLHSFRRKFGLGKKVGAIAPNLEEVRRLASAGVGLCILPENMAKAGSATETGLWLLVDRPAGASCDIFVVTKKLGNRSNSAAIFLEETMALRDNGIPDILGPCGGSR